MKYGYQKTINRSFDEVDKTIREKLKELGFGVLTEIDVKKTMKEKLGEDFREYKILGACNPPIAHQALAAELGIGLLLPCNVVIWENDDGSTTMAAIDAQKMLSITGRDDLVVIAARVNNLLRKALDAV